MAVYLLTGGNGNLARQMAKQLLDEGNKVVLLDIMPSDSPVSGVKEVTGDIANHKILEDIFKENKPEFVCHMASLLSGSSEKDLRRSLDVNVGASLNLLQLSTDNKVKCFFFPSTAATYGSGLMDPLPEDFPQWPENFYGVTKVAVERIGTYFYFKKGLNFRSLRLPFVISQFAPPGALTAFASHAFVKAAAGEHVIFPVRTNTVISAIYVKDVIQGVFQFMNAPDDNLSRRVYNVQGFSPMAGTIASSIKSHLPDFSYAFEPDPDVVRLTDALPARIIDDAARLDWGWKPFFGLSNMTEDFLRELAAIPAK